MRQRTVDLTGPGQGGDGVVDADPRLVVPGGELAHGAQGVGDQLDVVSVVGGSAGLVVVVLRRPVVAQIEQLPAGDLAQLGVHRQDTRLQGHRRTCHQPADDLPLRQHCLHGDLRPEHVTLPPVSLEGSLGVGDGGVIQPARVVQDQGDPLAVVGLGEVEQGRGGGQSEGSAQLGQQHPAVEQRVQLVCPLHDDLRQFSEVDLP
jgi:hypothetical protein